MKTLKPILFSTPMVHANLEGRKTQTRRIIPQQSGKCMFCGCEADDCRGCIERTGKPCYWTNEAETICSACADLKNTSKAKYQIGDILYVRETWQYNDDLEEPYLYKQKFLEDYKPEFHCRIKWKPSIFMPKEAARVFLKVIGRRIERLQNISEYDAISEGVELFDTNLYKDYMDSRNGLSHARISFATLWEAINGKDSCNENPYVWVYDYERIEKP